MWYVASSNFATVDALLEHSQSEGFVAQVERWGRDEVRFGLRYMASELNRHFFHLWNWTQVLLIAVATSLIFSNKQNDFRDKLLVGTLAALIILMAAWLSPTMVNLGRTLDYLPRDPAPPDLASFQKLHGLFVILDGTKLGLIVLMAVRVARKPEVDP